MRVIVLGGDGYLGWPTAMHLSARGFDVTVVDNYLRRSIALQTQSEALIQNPELTERARIFQELTGHSIDVRIFDCTNYRKLLELFQQQQPGAVVHYAEQPSAPYSMRGYEDARLTLENNLVTTFNVIWATLESAHSCHIVKLGTMGEYGTPNLDIEEGWLEIEHKGRKDKFLYPRAAGSLYHTTKVLDTDLLWFYVRTFGLRVTDLMQGPVYGLSTAESDLDERLLPNYHYDDIFGTVVNRFLVQAVAGVPLTVYGKGEQKRGYLNLKDTLQCVELAIRNPVPSGELRILNQFTEVFSVNELAQRVQDAGEAVGLQVDIRPIENPRKEREEHEYRVANTGLRELGLVPHPMSPDVLGAMLDVVGRYRDRIDSRRILPRVSWK